MTQSSDLADELKRRSGLAMDDTMGADFADPLEHGLWAVGHRNSGTLAPEYKVNCPECGAKCDLVDNTGGVSTFHCRNGHEFTKKLAMSAMDEDWDSMSADARAITQADIDAANKMLGLKNKSTTELSDMIYNHANSKHFSGQVIAAAARAARENNMRMGSYDALTVTGDGGPMRKFIMIIEINGQRQTVGVETNDEQHAREMLAKLKPDAKIVSMQAQDAETNWNNMEMLAQQLGQAEEDDRNFYPAYEPSKEAIHRGINPRADDANPLVVTSKPVETKPVQAKPIPTVKSTR